MNKVTAVHSIVIQAPPEAVWDYTQNWRNRPQWDWTIVGAEYLSEAQPTVLQARGLGGMHFKVNYKVSDRPRLTTLVMTEIHHWMVRGGGGSWKYEAVPGGTRWTQHNTLVLRDGWLGGMLRPGTALMLGFVTRSIMGRAKRRVESSLLR